MKLSGIYRITNIVTGHFYIGSAVDIYGRWSDHKYMLERCRNGCRRLQNSWNKYGAKAFEFGIIEFVDASRLIEREQHWIDLLNATERGLNILRVAGSQFGAKRSEESRKRMSDAAKARTDRCGWSEERRLNYVPYNKGKKSSPETRAKLSAIQRGKPRKPHSPETLAKLSAAAKRRGMSLETLSKAWASRRGRPHSPETRAKMSASHKNRFKDPNELTKRSIAASKGWAMKKGGLSCV